MKFDYSISFSRSHRDLARKLCNELTLKGFSIFFDENFEHELLGKDGAEYFNNIFFRQSKYCIAFLSSDYDKSSWTKLERRAIQAREFDTEPGYLIPILVDGYKPEWLLPTRIYFDLSKRDWNELIDLLSKKIELNYYGPFKITQEIKDFSAIRAIRISSTDKANEYLIWSGYIDGEPFEIYKLFKNENNSWIIEAMGIKDRGQFLYKRKNRLIAIPDFGDEVMSVYNLIDKSKETFILPRKAKWRSITDCDFDGENIYFTFCGAGCWIYQIADKKCIRFINDDDHSDHAYFGLIKKQNIIIGFGNKILLYSENGEFLDKIDSPEYINAMDINITNGQIIVGGSKYLYFINANSKTVSFKHQIMAYFVYKIKSSRENGVVACLSGFPMTSNVLEIFNAEQNICYGQIDTGRYKCWNDLAISKDGNSILGLMMNGFSVNDPDNKLIIFEKSQKMKY